MASICKKNKTFLRHHCLKEKTFLKMLSHYIPYKRSFITDCSLLKDYNLKVCEKNNLEANPNLEIFKTGNAVNIYIYVKTKFQQY